MATFNSQRNFTQVTLKTAYYSLLQHRLRTTLSILGVVCGVMAVVAILAIGEGAKQETMRQIEQMGVTNIYIRADQLTPDQLNRARQHHSDGLQDKDRSWLQNNNNFIRTTAALRERALNLTGLPEHLSPKLIECTAGYRQILGIKLEHGRFISHIDVDTRKQVCVLGWKIARELGSSGNIGNSLHIGGQLFRIVGTLGRQDLLNTSDTKISLQDLNETIFFPLGTIQVNREVGAAGVISRRPLSEIVVEVDSADHVMIAASLIRRSMEIAHKGVDDFQLIIPLELLAQSRKIQGIFNLVLSIIGAISLVIGGIGIMNVLLANISERIKEIGLRRAVGARPKHIFIQFLSEAVLLTFIGGLCGIIGGICLSLGIALLTEWPIQFSLYSFIIPLSVSIFIGLFFGLYPAMKASQMDPIAALNNTL